MHEDRYNQNVPGFLFFFFVLVIGGIMLPCGRCGQAIGLIDPSFGRPEPPSDCHLRTQAQCDKDRQDRIDHPYWFRNETAEQRRERYIYKNKANDYKKRMEKNQSDIEELEKEIDKSKKEINLKEYQQLVTDI
jgi:hypothetical protein